MILTPLQPRYFVRALISFTPTRSFFIYTKIFEHALLQESRFLNPRYIYSFPSFVCPNAAAAHVRKSTC
jgi:hypothetical protein